MWLLPVRPHRRPDRVEPGPIRPPAQGLPDRGSRNGPGELGRFLFTAERYDSGHAALAALLGLNGLRVSEACAANIEDLGVERGHRTLRIVGKGNKPAVIPLVPRVRHGPSTWPSESDTMVRICAAATASDWTGAPRIAGCAPSANEPVSGSSTPTCSAQLS